MDITCRTCGEPWDMECLHVEAAARYERDHGIDFGADFKRDRDGANTRYEPVYTATTADFRVNGCKAFALSHGVGACTPVRSERTAVAEAAFEMCGDDTDGAASMMEDL